MLIFKTFYCLVVLGLIISLNACDLQEDGTQERDSQLSSIVPPTLLFNNLAPITLISPLNGEAYYIDDRANTDLVFRYNQPEADYFALMIFKEQPQVSNGVIINSKSICLGGSTNMAVEHHWQQNQAALSLDTDRSNIFACDSASVTDAFSRVTLLTLDETHFPKNSSVYWVMLGYNGHHQITHASPLRKINIK